MQLGWAEGRVSPFTRHLGFGGVLRAPSRRRSQDAIGTAITWANFSRYPQSGFNLPSELVFESYYKATITKNIALVQDFQYLRHPGGLQANSGCAVITPRMIISF